MVNDLMDIAGEVVEAAAIAGASSFKSEKEIEKERKEKKKKAMPGLIIAIITMIALSYLLLWRWGGREMNVIIDEVGYTYAIITIGITLIIILLLGVVSYFKKKDKKLKKIYVFMILSAICTTIIISALYPDLPITEPLQLIPIIAFTFAITLMFFLLFHKIGEVKVNQFLRLPYHLLIRFFIPMMIMCIFFLGAMQGKYQYESVFLSEAQISINNTFGGTFGQAIYGIIENLFNLGAARPNLFIFLTVAVALYLLYDTIRYAFWKETWPFYSSSREEYAEAQYFIEEADDKYISKEDLNAFKKGKIRLQKKYLNNEENLKGGEER